LKQTTSKGEILGKL